MGGGKNTRAATGQVDPNPSTSTATNEGVNGAAIESEQGGIQSIILAQNETLKQFTTTQNNIMQTLADTMKTFTQQLNPNQDLMFHEQQIDGDSLFDDEMNGILSEVPDTADSKDDNEEEISEELQSMIEQLSGDKALGPKLGSATAKAFESIGKFVLTKDVLEEWKDVYKVPENCQQLTVPAVNTEIWSGLPTQSKTTDLKWQSMQHNLLRAQIALAVAMDKAVNVVGKESLPMLLRPILDAGKSLQAVNADISLRRKAALKPNMRPEYVGLCSSKIAVTGKLFGDSLEQNMKEVKATSSILKPTGVQFSGKRFQPYRPSGFRPPSFPLNYQRPSQAGHFRAGMNRFRPPFRGQSRFPQHQFNKTRP